MSIERPPAARSLAEVAAEIAERTACVAHADSRFGRDFTQFIPGFDGAPEAARGVVALSECWMAKRAFVTPDNAVAGVRQRLLQRGVDLVVPSYGLHRGLLEVRAASLPESALPHAGWLDCVEHYGVSLPLDELAGGGAIDVIVTGASAVTVRGLRFGMGDVYLDIEWGILRALGLVDDDTPVIACVHDTQISELPFDAQPGNVTADIIVTPSQTIRADARGGRVRPAALDWSIVPPSLMRTTILQEFRQRSAGGAGHSCH